MVPRGQPFFPSLFFWRLLLVIHVQTRIELNCENETVRMFAKLWFHFGSISFVKSIYVGENRCLQKLRGGECPIFAIWASWRHLTRKLASYFHLFIWLRRPVHWLCSPTLSARFVPGQPGKCKDSQFHVRGNSCSSWRETILEVLGWLGNVHLYSRCFYVHLCRVQGGTSFEQSSQQTLFWDRVLIPQQKLNAVWDRCRSVSWDAMGWMVCEWGKVWSNFCC